MRNIDATECAYNNGYLEGLCQGTGRLEPGRTAIDPAPILRQLLDAKKQAKGLTESLLEELVVMLTDAPDVGGAFAMVDGQHINARQIRSFFWKNGELCLWYAGRHFFESWPDPQGERYRQLCASLGVKPMETQEENVYR